MFTTLYTNPFTFLPEWLLTLGEPFAIGLPLLASLLAVMGYFATRVLWYLMVKSEWKKRAAKKGSQMNALFGGLFYEEILL